MKSIRVELLIYSQSFFLCQVGKLARDQEYVFRVLAENRFGKSDPLDSTTVLVQYPFKRPGAPGQPEVVNCTRDSITIVWQEPTSDGGIVQYLVC